MDYHQQALEILQNKTALVISGGGCRGYAVCGSLLRLHELGLSLKNISSVSGSSVGSIIATAIAARGSIYYINEKMSKLNLKDLENHTCIISEAFNLLKNYGLHKTTGINDLMTEVLTELTGNADITFKELFDRTNIHLTITYLSLNYKRTLYADYINEPNSIVREAVVKSSSMPLFYEAFMEGNKKDRKVSADGGVMNNYPMNIPREQGYEPSKILGLKFISPKDIKYCEVNNYGPPKNVIEYLSTMVEILREQAMRIHVSEKDWMLSAKINVGDILSTSFDLTQEQKDWLFKQGRDAIDEHVREVENLLKEDKFNCV